MSSVRLPGKILREASGKPLLVYLVDRLELATSLDAIVLATSADASDNVVADFCQHRGIQCYRGDLENVARRFLDVVEIYDLDAFVRISGDSPLLDPALVERAIGYMQAGELDLVTNVWPRSYPPGQSVEAVRADAFRRAFEQMVTPEEREHVTKFLYAHTDQFRILNFKAENDATQIHLAVDTAQDFAVFEALLAAMDRPHQEYNVDELIQLYRRVIQPQ